jgi:hypothetical protein
MAVDAPPRRLGVETKATREWLVILLAAFAVMVAGLLLGRATPTHLDEITIENPTENDLTLLAQSPGESRYTFIGNVDRDETRTLEAVLDQGDTWVIRFRYADTVVAEETVTRQELVDGWTIPDSVGDAVAEAGFSPSAP